GAVSVDDEPAAGAAARRLAPRWAEVGALERIRTLWRSHSASAPPWLAASARRVDVDDSRIDALDDVREAERRGGQGRCPRPGGLAPRPPPSLPPHAPP